MKKTFWLILLLIFSTALQQVNADPSRLINYQGRLVDSNGVPLADGSYDMTFKIYDALTGGTLLWTEAHTGGSAVAVTNGLFSVVLGPTSMPDFNSTPYYIEITVGATVYSPRKQLTGSPFAVNADLLDGQHGTYYQRRVGSTCGVGSSIRIINADGTVTCQTDVGSAGHGTLSGLGNDDHPQYFALAQDEIVTGRPAFNGGTTGTNSPFDVDSTYLVANLNADLLDGYNYTSFILDGCTDCLNATEIEDIYVLNTSDTMSGSLGVGTSATVGTTLGVTGAITGASTVQGTRFISTIVTGTAPLAVSSTTNVTNLSADMLDGYHYTSFILDGCTDCLNATEIEDIYVLNTSDTMSGTLGVTGAITGSSTVQGTQLISTIVTGTAPLAVSSTTNVTNLNADLLDNYHASAFALSGHTHATLTRSTGLTGGNYDGSAAQTWAVSYGSTAGTAVQGNQTLTVTGTGITVGGSPATLGAGSTVTLATIYGSTANTAVQGNNTLGITAGTGVSVSGSPITLGTGGNITVNVDTTWSDGRYVLKAGDTMLGRLGQSSSGFVAATKDDLVARTDSGFFQTSSPTPAEGWPAGAASWYHLLATTHTNDANYYSMQFAGDFFDSNNIYYRATNNSGLTAWNKIWHSGNDGSGSGLDADLLDGQHGAYYMPASTDNWVNITGDTMTGELITPAIRVPATAYSSGVPADFGDTAVDYPANAGWAATYNATILLSGLNSTSIAFHDSGQSVGVLRYTNNNFYLGESGPWGVSSLYVGNNINLGGEFQADKVCRFTSAFAINGSTTNCPAGYCAEAIVNDTTKNVMAMGDYNQRGVTQFATGRLMCCRCSISYP